MLKINITIIIKLTKITKKHHILKLIESGEGQQLDFKFEISDAAKIARSLVAFANTDGGRLLIGVKDNGRISGIRSEEEFYMVENAAMRYCFPEVSFRSKEWNIDGKKVLEIIIQRSDNIPHKAPDPKDKPKAYIRYQDQNILANGIQMKIWQKSNNNKDIKFVYSDEARELLGLFSVDSPLLLRHIINKTNMSRFKTESMLADLIIMKVIIMQVSELSASFLLNDTVEKDY